jgi:membrane-bound serine protease (ClpP class)
MRLVLRSRKWKQVTGREEMIGAEGVVIEPVGNGPHSPEGLIRIHGELWRATSEQPVAEGKSVRVLRIDGLKLYVEPTESSATAM